MRVLHNTCATLKGGALAALALVLTSPPVEAAAPWLMLFHGKPLTKIIALENWDENLKFMLAASEPSNVRPLSLASRACIGVAMFWGPQSKWIGENDNRPTSERITIDKASQRARFCPATGDEEAVFAFESIPGPGALNRRVSTEGLAILKKYGVPVVAPRR